MSRKNKNNSKMANAILKLVKDGFQSKRQIYDIVESLGYNRHSAHWYMKDLIRSGKLVQNRPGRVCLPEDMHDHHQDPRDKRFSHQVVRRISTAGVCRECGRTAPWRSVYNRCWECEKKAIENKGISSGLIDTSTVIQHPRVFGNYGFGI